MKKGISLFLALVLLAGCGLLSGCGGKADGGELNLYTWEGMFPQEVLDGFTTETGIRIRYSGFDSNETMLAKLEAAEGGDYDLVIADDYIIETVINENLAQKLDKTQLSNLGNVNPAYTGQFYDKTNEYTVPYGAGVQTIVYNPDAVQKPITGYGDLWDESLRDSVGIIANYRVINGMALKTMGQSYNTCDTAVIEQAGEKLLTLAPNIRLIKDDNLQDDLISGEVAAAVMYTSQVTMAKMADPGLKVVYPEEGIGFGVMAQFIPVNAPHSAEAHAFINYILRPEVSAKCYEYMGFYCTNSAADALIAPEYKEFLTLPENWDASDMEMIENISAEAEEAHMLAWTKFKSETGR